MIDSLNYCFFVAAGFSLRLSPFPGLRRRLKPAATLIKKNFRFFFSGIYLKEAQITKTCVNTVRILELEVLDL